MMESLGITTVLETSFQEALDRTREALKAHGFGVLTEIDVASTLKQKLGVDRRPYQILGACMPSVAHRVLEAEPAAGLFMPCNVVVYETDEGVVVSAMNPEAAMEVLNNPALSEPACEVAEKLEAVINSLGGKRR
jgi:uncharacterized protein (DUF302 family)